MLNVMRFWAIVIPVLVILSDHELVECRGRRRGGSLDGLAGKIRQRESFEMLIYLLGYAFHLHFADLFASGISDQDDPYALENIIPSDLMERTRQSSASARFQHRPKVMIE